MSFEFNAEKYKKASAHQQEWGKKLTSEFDFFGNENILDLGCGDGRITAQLAERVPDGNVVGIDASKNMIHSATTNYKARNLQFDLLDINEINFENEFDIIISNAALHWIKDHSKLLSSVHKALKTNGIARFNFAADGNCSAFFRVVQGVMAEKKYAAYFNQFGWPWYMPVIDEYEGLINKYDFSETRVWGEKADKFFPNIEAMVGWLDQPSLVPFLKCLDSQKKVSFRDTVIDRMITETIQNDGRSFETFRRINVWAKK